MTPGGEHADGLTRNALVPLGDGICLELVAFVDPEDGRGLLPREGLVHYCVAPDGLRERVERSREQASG